MLRPTLLNYSVVLVIFLIQCLRNSMFWQCLLTLSGLGSLLYVFRLDFIWDIIIEKRAILDLNRMRSLLGGDYHNGEDGDFRVRDERIGSINLFNEILYKKEWRFIRKLKNWGPSSLKVYELFKKNFYSPLYEEDKYHLYLTKDKATHDQHEWVDFSNIEHIDFRTGFITPKTIINGDNIIFEVLKRVFGLSLNLVQSPVFDPQDNRENDSDSYWGYFVGYAFVFTKNNKKIVRLNLTQVTNLFKVSFSHCYKLKKSLFFNSKIAYEVGLEESYNFVIENPNINIRLYKNKIVNNVLFDEEVTSTGFPIYLSYLSLVISLYTDYDFQFYGNLIIMFSEIYRKLFLKIYNRAIRITVLNIKIASSFLGQEFFKTTFDFLMNFSNIWDYCDKETGLRYLTEDELIVNPLGEITGLEELEISEIAEKMHVWEVGLWEQKNKYYYKNALKCWRVKFDGFVNTSKPSLVTMLKEMKFKGRHEFRVHNFEGTLGTHFFLDKEKVKDSRFLDRKIREMCSYKLVRSIEHKKRIEYVKEGFIHLRCYDELKSDDEKIGDWTGNNRLYYKNTTQSRIVLGSEESGQFELFIKEIFGYSSLNDEYKIEVF
jgi:hypothetical protein